jgi:hypothetical protein
MIVSEMLYPGERPTELQQSLTQNVIERDSWRNLRKRTRTDRLFSYGDASRLALTAPFRN